MDCISTEELKKIVVDLEKELKRLQIENAYLQNEINHLKSIAYRGKKS